MPNEDSALARLRSRQNLLGAAARNPRRSATIGMVAVALTTTAAIAVPQVLSSPHATSAPVGAAPASAPAVPSTGGAGTSAAVPAAAPGWLVLNHGPAASDGGQSTETDARSALTYVDASQARITTCALPGRQGTAKVTLDGYAPSASDPWSVPVEFAARTEDVADFGTAICRTTAYTRVDGGPIGAVSPRASYEVDGAQTQGRTVRDDRQTDSALVVNPFTTTMGGADKTDQPFDNTCIRLQDFVVGAGLPSGTYELPAKCGPLTVSR